MRDKKKQRWRFLKGDFPQNLPGQLTANHSVLLAQLAVRFIHSSEIKIVPSAK